MEGATGVTCPDDCTPGSPRWDRFRSLFTADVAAVCAGFFAAGVTEVTVNEAHSTMRNLILEALDPRVCLLTGHHKPFGMMEGITARPAAMAACVPTVERTATAAWPSAPPRSPTSTPASAWWPGSAPPPPNPATPDPRKIVDSYPPASAGSCPR